MESKSKVFIFIRFSILLKERRGTELASKSTSEGEYIRALFDKSRMDEKMSTFRNITLRSLVSQSSSDVDVRVVVLTSDILPKPVHENLLSSLSVLDETSINYSVCYITSGAREVLHLGDTFDSVREATSNIMSRHLQGCLKDTPVCSVRLDDDDGLSSQFLCNLKPYLRFSCEPFVLSFSYGYQGVYDFKKNSINQLKHLYSPKLALGLALISPLANVLKKGGGIKSIFDLGRHTRLDEKMPVITVANSPMWFRTIAKHNDSGDKSMLDSMFSVSSFRFDDKNFWYLRDKVRLTSNLESESWAPSKSTMEKAQIKKLKKRLKDLKR